MKLKQLPEDFQVEELTHVVPAGQGAFALYRLDKSGWATPDAIQAIRRRWGLDLQRVSYGGLKDRHATTAQYLTIYRGHQRGLTHHQLKLKYLGQTTTPFTSKDIDANRFCLTLRAVREREIEQAEQAIRELTKDGVPNYFDDQRFGSVGEKSDFVARRLILGEYEQALRLALTLPYEFDRAAERKEKEYLDAHWGEWKKCKEKLSRGHARSLVDYLVSHPTDFKGATARLRPDLRGLYLSAYQSHLWNRMLAKWLVRFCRPEQIVELHLRRGKVPFHRILDDSQRDELAGVPLPLPSARLKVEEDQPVAGLITAVLSKEGFELAEMKIRAFREPFFSKGERAALCLPANLKHEWANDELNKGLKKLLLRFDLPRGSYATLLVKRIQQTDQSEDPSEND